MSKKSDAEVYQNKINELANMHARNIQMISECCGSPPLLSTDVHDGIAICDACREWSGFYDEEEDEPKDETITLKSSA